MEKIEPELFDIIVVGSGLVEGLLAGALVRAGKSVLLIDQTDVYGSDEASFTLAGLMGSTDPQLNPNICATEQHAQPDPVLPSRGMRLVRIPPPALPVMGVDVWSVPGADLRSTRAYILDLAPKVLYQGEPLVDALVSMRAHNYLEFKAVEGSYIWCGAHGLRRVPASRADIFRDRSLSLADKRGLMASLTACMEAHEQRSGRLAAAVSKDEPLARVLGHEGLSPLLQDVILHGIAMADWAQPPRGEQGLDAQAQQQTQPQPEDKQQQQQMQTQTQTQTHPQPEDKQQQQQQQTQTQTQTHPQPEDKQQQMQTQTQTQPQPNDKEQQTQTQCLGRPGGHAACVPAPVGARAGCASLALFTHSLGRFGAPGAFMTPSYGAGSLPEALVRHAAVHGAVTALRQALVGLVLGPEELRAAGTELAGAVQQQQQQHEKVQQQEPHIDDGSAAGKMAVLGCLTASGQVLWCKEALIAGPRALSGLLWPTRCPHDAATTGSTRPTAPASACSSSSSSSSSSSQPSAAPTPSAPAVDCPSHLFLSRAAIILDSPLHVGEAAATVVLPPGTPGCGNPHAIRGLQLAPSMCVAPQGRYLLYLSTPSTPRACSASLCARSDLERAVQLLAECGGLQAASQGSADAQAPSQATVAHMHASGPGAARLHDAHQEQAPVRAPSPERAGLQAPCQLVPQPGSGSSGRSSSIAAATTEVGSHAGASGAGVAAQEGSSPPKPRALQVYYYLQQLAMPVGLHSGGLAGAGAPLHQEGSTATHAGSLAAGAGAAAVLPAGLVCCPGPSPSMVGCTAAVACARALLAAHFPGVLWVGERGTGSPEEGEEDANEQGSAPDEDEEAIMALQASLDQLKALEEVK